MGCLSAGGVQAQPWPTRPLTFVVPVTAGTATDILARVVGKQMGERLGQSIIVENKPGASGNIGSEAVAKAPPDGYSVLITTINLSMAPALFPQLSYSPAKDLAAVGMIAELPLALAVNAALPVDNLSELVKLAKQQPGKLNYATPGNATPHHFGVELLKQATGMDLMHVPYKGTSGALVDIAAGRAQVGYFSVANVLSYLDSGKMKILATGSENRLPLSPNVPTLRELGLKNAEILPWVGAFVPAGTPAPIIAKLEKTMLGVMRDPAVAEQLIQQGFVPAPRSAQEMDKVMQSDLVRWPKVAAKAHITAE